MNSRFKLIVVLIIALMMVGLTFVSASTERVLKEGDQAPEFALNDANGKMFRLSDYRGKIVAMGFMRKAENKAEGEKWMAENRRWLVELDKLFRDKAVIIGVFRADVPFYFKPFAKLMMNKAPVRALPDWDGEAIKKYPSDSLFNLYVVDKAGRIERIISEPYSVDSMKKLSDHIKNLMKKEEE